MTDDLVRRLRSPEVFLMTSGMVSPVAEEAADEIERLREVLREVISVSDRKTDIYDRAKAVLAGEKTND